jgi:hypothetical protein
LLHPRGVVIVADTDEPPLPFTDRAFNLAIGRRSATTSREEEIARVLHPGGIYFAQHVGLASVFELIEFFLGPQPAAWRGGLPEGDAAAAEAAGLGS